MTAHKWEPGEVDHQPPAFHSSKPSVQRAWMSADKYLADPSVIFTRWLDHEGFESVPDRTHIRNTIHKRIKKLDLWSVASDWMAEARRAMTRLKLKKLTPQVAREIAWRLVESKMLEVGESALQQREMVEVSLEVEMQPIKGMDYLPDYMRWAVMHPGLNFVRGDIRDEVVQATCDKFEEVNPCPNQAARNAFERYRGDTKSIDVLFKDCAKMYVDMMKKQAGAKPVVDEAGDRNAAQTQSIRERLGMA